ncbi:SRPBCC family protein [Actinomadura alba]|uniref:SRPBCC domain-containing protein n=1 Tax=Actinomadura alba TaxID=406431 RepID=A0ABR7LRN2_9ACTN|nr:SRPBCC domain-containing protein [Actinomadura alba]MBC6467328.1 SRPBCC domain-containing protein [Actinomadura alba]
MSEPMIRRARVAAPISDVHHALTDATALRIWLAEHAEVDLPHRFEFWGRHTPEGEAPHQRLLHVDDHTLRFSWLLDGEDTTVEIGLAADTEDDSADGDSTIITLSQTHFEFSDAFTGAGIRGVLNTFWALALANLVDYLEGREPTPRCDFTSQQMNAQVLIDTSPEEVFDSLIDSDKTSRWFGCRIDIEPHVGGRYAMGGVDAHPHPAKILDLEPGRRLSVDWGGPGVTTWELDGTDGATRLTLIQSGFDTQEPPYAAWSGILAGLAELRRFHDLPHWRPIWLSYDLPDTTTING